MALYDFDSELRRSLKTSVDHVRQMIESVFGPVSSVRRSTAEEERRGIDFVFVLPSGREQFVDLKERRIDYIAKSDDLVLETIACTSSAQPGWTVDPAKQTDWTLWHWSNSGRFRFVSAHLLRSATLTQLDTWSADDSMKPQATLGRHERYESKALCVPSRNIALAMWQQSTGSL